MFWSSADHHQGAIWSWLKSLVKIWVFKCGYAAAYGHSFCMLYCAERHVDMNTAHTAHTVHTAHTAHQFAGLKTVGAWRCLLISITSVWRSIGTAQVTLSLTMLYHILIFDCMDASFEIWILSRSTRSCNFIHHHKKRNSFSLSFKGSS
jgi:hypothetical protein